MAGIRIKKNFLQIDKEILSIIFRNRFFHFSPEDALTLMGPRMEHRYDLNWMFLYQLVPYLVSIYKVFFTLVKKSINIKSFPISQAMTAAAARPFPSII